MKHNISFRDSSSLGRFEITVGPKQTMGKTVEGVTVTSQMPKGVLNMTLTPSQGTHTFDPVTKVRREQAVESAPSFFLVLFILGRNEMGTLQSVSGFLFAIQLSSIQKPCMLPMQLNWHPLFPVRCSHLVSNQIPKC